MSVSREQIMKWCEENGIKLGAKVRSPLFSSNDVFTIYSIFDISCKNPVTGSFPAQNYLFNAIGQRGGIVAMYVSSLTSCNDISDLSRKIEVVNIVRYQGYELNKEVIFTSGRKPRGAKLLPDVFVEHYK